MAGSLNASHEQNDLEVSHEINVTPMIDVMLVLLIIFMVAAPLATVDFNVDLPASTAQPQERPDKPLYLTLRQDLSVALGDDTIQRGSLQATLDAFTGGDRDTRVFLRADKAVDYGALMELMNQLRAAGYLKIALVGLESVPAGAGATAPSSNGTGTGSAPPATPTNGATL